MPSATATLISTPVRLDGVLNEPAWYNAQPVNGFIQREPSEGTPATEKTEVRLIYNEDNLYIGVKCYDSDPGCIVSNELRFDGNLENDDNFTVVLDTFNDQRTGYIFVINPNGARYDALIKDVDHSNDDWNGIWDAAGKVTDYGWSAEMVIPFMAIRFPKTSAQEWGINFRRMIRHKDEEALWSAWGRDDGIQQLTKAGKLNGLNNIKRGKQTEFVPYVLGGIEKERGIDADNTVKYGLDIKYPLTSDLTLDFTTKTDFAQVESDKEQINLTQFSLQYPEKRGFFLEGAEIFDFTQGRSHKLYYSRRIGITPDPDREQVPILGGAKLSGKTGAYSIGIMNMQAEETTVYTVEDDSTETKKVYPATNYSVVRIKRDVFKQSYIGFIGSMVNKNHTPDIPATGEDRIDRFLNKRTNQLAGVDFSLRTNSFLNDKNFYLSGYFAGSNTPGLSGDNLAGRVMLDFPNDLIDSWFVYHVIDDNFNTESGYVRRTGIKQTSGVFRYMPRVGLPHVRKLRIVPAQFSYTTDMDDKLVEREITITPLGFFFTNDDWFEFTIENKYDYINEDFDIFDSHVIPKGAYDAWDYGFFYRSLNVGRETLFLEARHGDFYYGTRTFCKAAYTYKFNKYFSVTPDISYNDITLGDDRFETKEASFRFRTNLSTRLTSSTFIQWNNDTDEANLNFRIHYIPRIGSDVYVVYNHLWDDGDRRDFRTLSETAIIKVNYLFRI